MKIILANQSMIDELSHAEKNEQSLLKKKKVPLSSVGFNPLRQLSQC